MCFYTIERRATSPLAEVLAFVEGMGLASAALHLHDFSSTEPLCHFLQLFWEHYLLYLHFRWETGAPKGPLTYLRSHTLCSSGPAGFQTLVPH